MMAHIWLRVTKFDIVRYFIGGAVGNQITGTCNMTQCKVLEGLKKLLLF